MEKIVIYDLDGTLIDVSERLSKSLEEVGIQSLEEATNEQYDKVMKILNSKKYIDTDKPKEDVINQLKQDADENGVFIMTGRVGEAKDCTKQQLKKFGIPYDEIVFVNEDLRDIKSTAENKAQKVAELQKQYEIIKFVDDMPENREAVAEIIGEDKVVDPSSNSDEEKTEKEIMTSRPKTEEERQETHRKLYGEEAPKRGTGRGKTPEQEITEYAMGMKEE